MILILDGNCVMKSTETLKFLGHSESGDHKFGDIRDLGHTVDREKAAIGVFLTLEKPSKDMITEAVGTGFYHSPGWNKDFPKLHFLTIEELLDERLVQLPASLYTLKNELENQ